MNGEHLRKTVLRMIPYGIYVLTVEVPGEGLSGSSVTWVTQSSFRPPRLLIGLKRGTHTHESVARVGRFGLNILDKGQADVALKFARHVPPSAGSIGGELFYRGEYGVPLLARAQAGLECSVATVVEEGDHSSFVVDVLGATVGRMPGARLDADTLTVSELGEKVYYAG